MHLICIYFDLFLSVQFWFGLVLVSFFVLVWFGSVRLFETGNIEEEKMNENFLISRLVYFLVVFLMNKIYAIIEKNKCHACGMKNDLT